MLLLLLWAVGGCRTAPRTEHRDAGPRDASPHDGDGAPADTGAGPQSDAGPDATKVGDVQGGADRQDSTVEAREAAADGPGSGGGDAPSSDATVDFEAACSTQLGTAVPYTMPAPFLQCQGFGDASTLLVIENEQQLSEATLRYPCLGSATIQGVSFASNRLVIAAARGTVRWVGEVADAVVLAVTLYGGPAPGSQSFPIAVVLPRSDKPVRALYCQGGSGCVGSICPP
jgi:hypothetical protein